MYHIYLVYERLVHRGGGRPDTCPTTPMVLYPDMGCICRFEHHRASLHTSLTGMPVWFEALTVRIMCLFGSKLGYNTAELYYFGSVLVCMIKQKDGLVFE